jgi:hypothetical protein
MVVHEWVCDEHLVVAVEGPYGYRTDRPPLPPPGGF